MILCAWSPGNLMASNALLYGKNECNLINMYEVVWVSSFLCRTHTYNIHRMTCNLRSKVLPLFTVDGCARCACHTYVVLIYRWIHKNRHSHSQIKDGMYFLLLLLSQVTQKCQWTLINVECQQTLPHTHSYTHRERERGLYPHLFPSGLNKCIKFNEIILTSLSWLHSFVFAVSFSLL